MSDKFCTWCDRQYYIWETHSCTVADLKDHVDRLKDHVDRLEKRIADGPGAEDGPWATGWAERTKTGNTEEVRGDNN